MEEDKGLDLNQPFISVRRSSPAVPSSECDDKSSKTDRILPMVPQPPPYRSGLKSGPLSKPGTVPFTWEQSPGRPKYEEISLHQSLQCPPIAPKLPPGRAVNPKQYESQDQAYQQPPLAPKLPPRALQKPKQDESNKASDHIGKDIRPQESAPADNLIAKHDRPEESTEMGMKSGVEDGDETETYFDAPDNLSQSESFFVNCSISGLSGLDGPDLGSPGTFAADPQVQDFMMGRFLPAAKAMASETPPHSHAPKKQPPVATEKPRLQVKKASNMNKQHPLYRYNSSFLHRYISQASGSESEDDDNIEPENSTAKACGLLPRFLLKSSFCILDAKQDMGVQGVEKLKMKSKPSKTNAFTHKRDTQKMKVSAGNENFTCKISSSASHSILPKDKEAKEKASTSFRDLLASEGDEWKSPSGSRGPVMERTLYIDSVQTKNSHNSDVSSVSGPPSYRWIDSSTNAVDEKVKEASYIESNIREITIIDGKEIPGERANKQVDSVSVSSLPDGRSIEVEATSLFDSSPHEIKHIAFVEDVETPGYKDLESVELNCSEQRKFLTPGTVPEKCSSTCHTDENIEVEQQSTARSSNHGSNYRPPRSTFHIPPLLPKSPAELAVPHLAIDFISELTRDGQIPISLEVFQFECQ